MLPPGGQATNPPSLDAEFNSLGRGNLLMDFETLELMVWAHALDEVATYDVIPET